MAKYHTNLKYHKDEIEKRVITREDLEFLKELQKELNTQDHISQADPRFWVIKGSEKIYHTEDADGCELYNKDCCEVVGENIEEICNYIKNNILEDINDNYGMNFTLSVDKNPYDKKYILVQWEENGENESLELNDKEDIANWLEEYGYDELIVINYQIVPKIYENTMFLTQIDAENHLKNNHYHYDEDAHTYAMTAWRSSRVEKLIKLLQTIDLDSLYDKI